MEHYECWRFELQSSCLHFPTVCHLPRSYILYLLFCLILFRAGHYYANYYSIAIVELLLFLLLLLSFTCFLGFPDILQAHDFSSSVSEALDYWLPMFFYWSSLGCLLSVCLHSIASTFLCWILALLYFRMYFIWTQKSFRLAVLNDTITVGPWEA